MSRKEGIFSASPHFPHFELLHRQRAGRIFRPLKPPGRMLRYKALGGPHPAPHNCAFPATSGPINQQPVVAGCTRKKTRFRFLSLLIFRCLVSMELRLCQHPSPFLEILAAKWANHLSHRFQKKNGWQHPIAHTLSIPRVNLEC